MKAKRIIAVISLLFFAILIILMIKSWKKYELYDKYHYPNEEFYGKELYSEITYDCSEYEAEIGKDMLDMAMKSDEYTGTSGNAVSQNVTLQLITCKISGNEGHVWVVYTRKGYDENGALVNVSSNILSLWYIERQGSEWSITQVREAP